MHKLLQMILHCGLILFYSVNRRLCKTEPSLTLQVNLNPYFTLSYLSFLRQYCFCFILFCFSSFLATLWHMKFPGQGSDLSCSFNLCHSCRNTESQPTALGWGLNPRPSAPETPQIPLHCSRNSSNTFL